LTSQNVREYSREMSLTNPYDDVELAQPQEMRALAHPVRLAILSRLQRHGSSTASRLSPEVGATPSVTSWHLRHLATFGLVRDAEQGNDARERWWEAVGRGFRFVAPDDPDDLEGQAAYRALTQQMFLQSDELPRRWLADVEEHLPPRWRKLSGLSNTRVVVGPAELAALERSIEELLAPYVRRNPEEAPRGSRSVRLMRYVMPEAGEQAGRSTRQGRP
jgi:DNA-binding transcriptional ArsR family regulator